MRKVYGSDISREQFESIREMLERAKEKTRPRKHDLYDIFCGVLYILKTACQWRMLPGDFPPWRTVHYYFAQWSQTGAKGEESLLERVLKKKSLKREASTIEKRKRPSSLWMHKA
jgi:transposase